MKRQVQYLIIPVQFALTLYELKIKNVNTGRIYKVLEWAKIFKLFIRFKIVPKTQNGDKGDCTVYIAPSRPARV